MTKVIIVSGGFDPVHIGHIRMFKQAAEMADIKAQVNQGRVIVALNSDEWLKRKKGKPFMPFEERKEILDAMECVTEVIKEWERTKLAWEATYMKFTQDTAQYPKEVEMEYLMLGLANEVGEVLGKYKKYLRGDKVVQQDFEKALVDEMGDVMWYFVRICDMLDVTLYEVMTRNINKLSARMKKGTIKGDGDDR